MMNPEKDEIEKILKIRESLNDAEKCVADMYEKKGWITDNFKFPKWPYSLHCSLYRGTKYEDHAVRVTHVAGELKPTEIFQFTYNDNWKNDPIKQIQAVLDHPPEMRSGEVRIRMYEVTANDAKPLEIRGTKDQPTRAQKRMQQEIVIREKRQRGWSWMAISKEVGLSRTTVRRIWARF